MIATITFFPSNEKKNVRNGMVPVYMRIIFKRAKAESRLNVCIPEANVVKWDRITMRILEKDSAINLYLNNVQKKFNDFIILNGTELPKYSARVIRNYVLGLEEKAKESLIDFVDHFYNNNVLKNSNFSKGTIKNYRRAVNHLKAFIKYTKNEKLSMDMVDVKFANDFKTFLVNTNPSLDRTGMTEVSAATIIKKFRTIFSLAVDHEKLSNNPFKKVKIITKSPRKERLSIEQVVKIRYLDLQLFPFLNLHRDIFLFAIYTGLAYRDLISLPWSQLEEKRDGNIKLTIRRIKSDVITESFLPSQAMVLAKKYRKSVDATNTDTIFPYRSNKELNTQIKLLAQQAGIPLRITMHTARHTYRQLLSEAGILDMGVIKRMMGQSRRGEIDETYYSITEKALLQAKNLFEKFLKSNFRSDAK